MRKKRNLALFIILAAFTLSSCSSSMNEPVADVTDLNNTIDRLEFELQEAEIMNQKLQDELEVQASPKDEPYEDPEAFFKALEEANTSVYDLMDFYGDHLTDLDVGSGYGEAFGRRVLDHFYSTDIDQFLKATRRIAPPYMDAFAGHMVTALHMAYQYDELTTQQFNHFVETFQGWTNNGLLDNDYRQLAYSVMANLYRDGDDPTVDGLFMPRVSRETLRVGETTISYYTGGGTVLEDGIFYVMEGYMDNELEWMILWEGIDVTELDVFSAITYGGDYSDNQIYQVVDGDLYVIDAGNGEVISKTEDVGQSHVAPVVYANGDVVTIGQYRPYVTYIDASGDVVWQKTDSLKFSGTWHISATDQTIEIDCDHGRIVIDRDGHIIDTE